MYSWDREEDSTVHVSWRESVCLGGCGVVMARWSEHWRLKPEALGSIPGGYPDVFSSSKLSDVDGVMSSVVL